MNPLEGSDPNPTLIWGLGSNHSLGFEGPVGLIGAFGW